MITFGKKRKGRVLIATLLIGVFVWSVRVWNSERNLENLTQHRESAYSNMVPSRVRNSEDYKLWKASLDKRYRRFCTVWLNRQQQGPSRTTRSLLNYLKDEESYIRHYAARALGRIEDAQAEPVLAKIARQQALARKRKGVNDTAYLKELVVPYPTLELALGRVRARRLKGRAKLEAVAREVGLSWGEVVRLAHKLNKDAPRVYGKGGSDGYEIVDEFVDLLYTMGKKGENITSYSNQLVVNPAQRIKLKAALVTIDAEVRLILDYLSRLEVVRGYDHSLAQSHLVGLGSRAHKPTIAYLRKMSQRPSSLVKREGVTEIPVVLALMHNPQALPELEQFERNVPDAYVKSWARDARQRIKARSTWPVLP